jgi:hypothetical protein
LMVMGDYWGGDYEGTSIHRKGGLTVCVLLR